MSERRRTTVYFSPETAKRLKLQSATEDKEMSAIVEGAVCAYFESLKKPLVIPFVLTNHRGHRWDVFMRPVKTDGRYYPVGEDRWGNAEPDGYSG